MKNILPMIFLFVYFEFQLYQYVSTYFLGMYTHGNYAMVVLINNVIVSYRHNCLRSACLTCRHDPLHSAGEEFTRTALVHHVDPSDVHQPHSIGMIRVCSQCCVHVSCRQKGHYLTTGLWVKGPCLLVTAYTLPVAPFPPT